MVVELIDGETNSGVWTAIVERVDLASRYNMLNESAKQYETVFEELEQLRRKLDKLAVRSNEQWVGEGARAFQGHVHTLAKTVKDIGDLHKGVTDGLKKLATDVHGAVLSIPVPRWLYDAVLTVQPAFRDGSATYGGIGIPIGLEPPWWIIVRRAKTPEQLEAIYKPFRDRAEAALRKLEADYERDYKLLPEGTVVNPPSVGPAGGSTNAPGNGRVPGKDPGNGQGSGAGSGDLGAGLQPSGLQIPTSAAGLTNPNTQLPVTQPPDLSGLQPPVDTDVPELPDIPEPDTSGLAGLGGGDLPGAGGLPGGGATSPSSVTSGFGAPGSAPRGLGVPGGGGSNPALGGMGMYPPMYPPMGGAGANGGQSANSDSLLQEDEVRLVFGFETRRLPDDTEPDEIPGNGVLNA